MKSDYLVTTELPNSLGVSAFILAANYHSPFECLEEISRELDRQSVRGAVVFDLLLANGTKINRYFLAQFDGKKFAIDSIQEVSMEYMNFSKVSAEMLKRSAKLIDDVLLTPAMKFAVRRGIPF
ncbi:type II toxin-antitoxin system RnlB family antitoxin [Pseudomonas sp. P7758]|uniref:type II toxin-antitoxin system RnlB family antitoxin n=1 Tax=Pseudomonas sp. P7758 TaxID=2738830 RepID=UPI0015A4E88A|nr:type II toxin-antitoxin system RnlB family antitoxin [Pseudomonas sp. P7758]NWC70328.1 type II toxin-antitoxin system RnlB family antitoxin [Pseudomonas sp. P7758]